MLNINEANANGALKRFYINYISFWKFCKLIDKAGIG